MINYRGKPVLGPDSSTKNTSEFFALAGTVLFWLLFMIFSFVIKPQPKKRYKEVQIVLSSTPVVQKIEESPAPAEQAASSAAAAEVAVAEVVETPAPKPEPVKKTVETPAPKKVETPKPKTQTQPKKEPAKASTKPAATPKQTEQPDVFYPGEVMDQFNSIQKTKPTQDFDWSKLDDEDEQADSPSPSKRVTNESTMSGSIGQTVTDNETKQISTTNSNNTTDVSSSTTSALNNVRNSKYSGKAPSGIQSETSLQTVDSGSGKILVPMSNGHSRALIDPKEPAIDIPPELYQYIDSTRAVKISFNVVPSGNVTDVRISPESSLHSSIRQEIIGQLLFWRFEPADYTATATFDYTIVKR